MVQDYLSTEEWDELNVLRRAISEHLSSVHPDKQERFTELLVKSLLGKGQNVVITDPSNY